MADTEVGVFWRWVRILALGFVILFLLGVATGFVAAHVEKGGGASLRSTGIFAAVILGIAGCAWLVRRDLRALAPPMNAGEGERLYAAQRKRFWMTIGALAFVGGLVGILGGFIWNFGDGPATLSPELIAAVSIGVIIAAVLTAYGSWRYFVSVDEVEVADNLWGSLIGFYAYSILFPTWWALWKLDQVSEPNDWSIFFTAMFVALAAYGWRKWQSR